MSIVYTRFYVAFIYNIYVSSFWYFFPFLCAILLVDFIPFYICLFLHLHTYTHSYIKAHSFFFIIFDGKTLSSSFNFIAVDWKISNDLLLLCFVYEAASAASKRKEETSLRDKWSLDLLMKNWFSFDTFFLKGTHLVGLIDWYIQLKIT